MASVFQFVIVSVFVAHLCSAISQHDTDVLLKVTAGVNDIGLPKTCITVWGTQINKNYNSDVKIDALCTDLTSKPPKLTLAPCKTAEVTKIGNSVCPIVTASNKERNDRVSKYVAARLKTSATCQKKAPGTLATWELVEDLCKNILDKDKKAYQTACPKGEYDNLKDVLLCGGAPALVSGLLAIGMSLVAFVFNKL